MLLAERYHDTNLKSQLGLGLVMITQLWYCHYCHDCRDLTLKKEMPSKKKLQRKEQNISTEMVIKVFAKKSSQNGSPHLAQLT